MSEPKLKYNNFDFAPSLTGVSFPAPYISRSKEISYNGEQQVETDSYSIEGSFYLNDPAPLEKDSDDDRVTDATEKLLEARNSIILFFSQNNKKLETDFGSLNQARLSSIGFAPSTYGALVNYSIKLVGISDFGAAGVVDITDEFSITEGANGSNTITHKVSAKGLETSSSSTSAALTNAKTWVNARLWNQDPELGLEMAIAPSLGQNFPLGLTPDLEAGQHPSLVMSDLSESIDRISAVYSITESYEYIDAMWDELVGQGHSNDSDYDAGSNNDLGRKMLPKYTFETSWDGERFCTVLSVKVTVRVSTLGETSLQDVKDYLVNTDGNINPPYPATLSAGILEKVKKSSVAPVAFRDRADTSVLIPAMHVYTNSLKSSSVDPNTGTITLDFVYDNDPRMEGIAGTSNVFFDYDIAVNTDWVQSTTEVSINGSLLTDPTLSVPQKRDALDTWFLTYKGKSLHTYLFNKAKNYYSDILKDNVGDVRDKMSGGFGENTPSSGGSSTHSSADDQPLKKLYNVDLPSKLNPIPSSLSASINQSDGTSSISATFNDADFLTGMRDTTFSANVSPSIIPYTPKASVVSDLLKDGHHIVFNPGGVRRAKWTASVSAKGAKDYSIPASSFSLLEQRIKNVLNFDRLDNKSGTDIIKDNENASLIYNDTTDAQSSFGYSLRTVNFWDKVLMTGSDQKKVDQQIYPPRIKKAAKYNFKELKAQAYEATVEKSEAAERNLKIAILAAMLQAQAAYNTLYTNFAVKRTAANNSWQQYAYYQKVYVDYVKLVNDGAASGGLGWTALGNKIQAQALFDNMSGSYVQAYNYELQAKTAEIMLDNYAVQYDETWMFYSQAYAETGGGLVTWRDVFWQQQLLLMNGFGW